MAGNNAQGSAQATVDHDEIRNWVEQHGGHPAEVKRTRRGNTPGILRIDFPGFSGQNSLEEISWDEFFQRFDESNLAFLYQDKTSSGRPSRFNKLVSRDTVDVRSSSMRKPKPRATRVTQESTRGQRRANEQAAPSRRKPTARGAARKAAGERAAAPRTAKRAATPRNTAKKSASSMSSQKKPARSATRSAKTRSSGSRAAKKRSTRKPAAAAKRSSSGR